MSKTFKNLLQNGYKKKKQDKNVDGFVRDETLSGQRAQVYHNPDTGKTIVSHRGTQGLKDVITDAKLLFKPSAYRKSDRYKHAQKAQDEAAAKYGNETITTIGHSLGARLASDVGKKSNNVVTYNKPVVPSDVGKKANPNELHVRTKYDPVSILAPILDKTKTVNVKSNSLLDSHNTDNLTNMKHDVLLGSAHSNSSLGSVMGQ
jgi:hypothetical protein